MIAQFAQILKRERKIKELISQSACIDSGTEGEENWQKGSSDLHVFLTPLLLANDRYVQIGFA